MLDFGYEGRTGHFFELQPDPPPWQTITSTLHLLVPKKLDPIATLHVVEYGYPSLNS